MMQMKYTMQEKYWIWLSSLEGIGPKRFYQLLEYFEDPYEVWQCNTEHLQKFSSFGRKTLQTLIENRNEKYMDQLFANFEKKGINAISRINSNYPVNLLNIFDPPPVLYVKGQLSIPQEKVIAIVGSRFCSRYGQQVAQKLGKELAEKGISIISGMARGIDTYAHIGCLSAKGKTLAVLGCGVDKIYPPENHKLYAHILENGGSIISEYLPGTPPLAQHFPARNRIISGLADGVVVVEAGEKSGALITVDYALDQGKDIFSVPGSILSKYSAGTNRLLREGAKIVTDVYDILEEFNWAQRKESLMGETKERPYQLDMFESMIVRALEEGDLSEDELVNQVGLPVQKINSVLTILELRGIIKQLPGKIFSKQN